MSKLNRLTQAALVSAALVTPSNDAEALFIGGGAPLPKEARLSTYKEETASVREAVRQALEEKMEEVNLAKHCNKHEEDVGEMHEFTVRTVLDCIDWYRKWPQSDHAFRQIWFEATDQELFTRDEMGGQYKVEFLAHQLSQKDIRYPFETLDLGTCETDPIVWDYTCEIPVDVTPPSYDYDLDCELPEQHQVQKPETLSLVKYGLAETEEEIERHIKHRRAVEAWYTHLTQRDWETYNDAESAYLTDLDLAERKWEKAAEAIRIFGESLGISPELDARWKKEADFVEQYHRFAGTQNKVERIAYQHIPEAIDKRFERKFGLSEDRVAKR